MRLEQLEYVAAVTQHGSLRRASERMHISQPALSEAVGKLERELGVTLLDRGRSGTRISRQGRALLARMTEVLQAADRLRDAAGSQRGDTRVIRVGTVDTATSVVVVPAVRAFAARHADTGVEVVDAQQSDVGPGLREGSLDLGLVDALPDDVAPRDLVTTTLIHGTLVAALPADHPLAHHEQVSLDQLRAEPFVAMRPGDVMHCCARQLFGDDQPTVASTAGGAGTAKALVAEGLGFALLPDYSIAGDPLHQAGVVTFRPIAGDVASVTLRLLQRPDHPLGTPVGNLCAALVERARTHTDVGRTGSAVT